MVFQNHFEAVQKSFSMASLNLSHNQVFALATACLACQYPWADSEVPQYWLPKYFVFLYVEM